MKKNHITWRTLFIVFLSAISLLKCFWQTENVFGQNQTYYLAINGDDISGDGSLVKPWVTITHALDNVLDGAIILVRPGIYNGRVRLRGEFDRGVTIRSEVAYQARLPARSLFKYRI